ncbi:MAG: hypothetical protein JW991_00430 [Candidatus Pacebacteria bacterium]|nr:hypothetical protein [Candidatus Paceibacterota bacterium]
MEPVPPVESRPPGEGSGVPEGVLNYIEMGGISAGDFGSAADLTQTPKAETVGQIYGLVKRARRDAGEAYKADDLFGQAFDLYRQDLHNLHELERRAAEASPAEAQDLAGQIDESRTALREAGVRDYLRAEVGKRTRPLFEKLSQQVEAVAQEAGLSLKEARRLQLSSGAAQAGLERAKKDRVAPVVKALQRTLPEESGQDGEEKGEGSHFMSDDQILSLHGQLVSGIEAMGRAVKVAAGSLPPDRTEIPPLDQTSRQVLQAKALAQVQGVVPPHILLLDSATDPEHPLDSRRAGLIRRQVEDVLGALERVATGLGRRTAGSEALLVQTRRLQEQVLEEAARKYILPALRRELGLDLSGEEQEDHQARIGLGKIQELDRVATAYNINTAEVQRLDGLHADAVKRQIEETRTRLREAESKDQVEVLLAQLYSLRILEKRREAQPGGSSKTRTELGPDARYYPREAQKLMTGLLRKRGRLRDKERQDKKSAPKGGSVESVYKEDGPKRVHPDRRGDSKKVKPSRKESSLGSEWQRVDGTKINEYALSLPNSLEEGERERAMARLVRVSGREKATLVLLLVGQGKPVSRTTEVGAQEKAIKEIVLYPRYEVRQAELLRQRGEDVQKRPLVGDDGDLSPKIALKAPDLLPGRVIDLSAPHVDMTTAQTLGFNLNWREFNLGAKSEGKMTGEG